MSPPRPLRVLILRTSRFLSVAASHAHACWPGAELRLLCQEGAEADAVSAGIAPGSCVPCPAGTRIRPRALVTSAWARHLLAWRPDIVVLQWWRRDGRGHEAATLFALLLQPRGCVAVLEDGGAIRMGWSDYLTRLARSVPPACRRCVAGVVVVMLVAAASVLLWPAAAWAVRHERAGRA